MVNQAWYVFPEGSDANNRLQTLPGIDGDEDSVDIVCSDGHRRGLWKIVDEVRVLSLLKREKEFNGLAVKIFRSINGSPPHEWKLAESDSKKSRLASLKKRAQEIRRKKNEKPLLF